MIRFISDLAGTLNSWLRINTVRLKDNSGTLDIKNAGDTAFSSVAVNELHVHGSNASNSVKLKAPSLSAILSLTLPATDGSAGDALTTDGSGNLSFSAGSSGTAAYTIKKFHFTQADNGTTSVFTPPASSYILKVQVDVTAAAAGGSSTIEVGISTSHAIYMANDLAWLHTVGLYEHPSLVSVGGSPVAVTVTINRSGSENFTGDVYIEYGNVL